MPIDNATWHARVGIFYAAKLLHKSKPKSGNANALYSLLFFLVHFCDHLSKYYEQRFW